MALTINSNISALNSQRQLVRSGRELDTAMERLSSGKRINSAADDAAGLAISNRMTSQVRGLNQAVRNANDGISLIQTAEGALDESTNILQRIRELAVQSANGVYADKDRLTLDAEVKQLTSELDRIAKTTSFNGQTLLDGSQQNISLQIGSQADQTISFGIPAMDVNNLGLGGNSADLVGAEMNINSSGLLTNGFSAASIKINGQALASVAANSDLQTLLDEINNNIPDVSASTYVKLQAESVGDGVLQGGNSFTIATIDNSGNSLSLVVTDTNSIDELVAAINEKSGSLYSASTDEAGRLQITSESMASISVSEDTGGIASGMSFSTIADGDIAATIEGLQKRWLAQAEKLITDFFGMTGSGVTLTLDLDNSDGVGGKLAYVQFNTGNPGTNISLNVDMADFTADNQPDGGSAPFYNDRIITHEMVHAVMTSLMDVSIMPGWFTEGVAELIHGADERVEGDFANLDTVGELTAAFKTSPGSPATSAGYSASYMAAKMLNDELLGAGGDITELFNELESGDSLDQAIIDLKVAYGGLAFGNLAQFEAYFLANGVDYLNETMGGNATLDLDNGDTGSIAGSDYTVNTFTATSIIPDSDIGVGDGSPGFEFVIPAEFAGTAQVAEAQLVLASENDEFISITQGVSGSDQLLDDLGFRTIAEVGEVLGEGLSVADQSAELAAGDLVINGVSIGSVASGAGLYAKIDAINTVSNETGVVASIEAIESFSYGNSPVTAVEYLSAAGGIVVATGITAIGLNGLGVSVTSGDSANDIASSINASSEYHGVTAYVDDGEELHLYSSHNINLSHTGGSLLVDLNMGALVGPAGSINLRGVDVALSDLTDLETVVTELNDAQGSTGVVASIDDNGELQFESSTSFTLALGDTNGLKSFAALGISFSTSDNTADLFDSDGDKLLGDETVTIQPRVKLDSMNDQSISISVTSDGESATGLSDLNEALSGALGSSIANLGVASVAEATAAITVVDSALETINSTRSQLGAVSNRLGFTISNLMNISENTAAARSRIVDADFAAETAVLSRAQVLQQAAQAMLAQANSAPQQVLALLR